MADDQLFLLEVLVDQIKFIKIPCFTDHDFKTCVSFQFLENAPLDICDSDGGGSTYSPDPAVKNMKNGKSCLFALKQSDIAKAKSNFLLNFSVYKTLPCSCLPQNVPIGKCTINMSKEFSEVAQQSAASPESPGSQSLKDSFPIKKDTGEETGQLNLFLRINCFGKVIVTGFQVADPEALPDRAIFQDAVSERAACNPKKDWKAIDDPCFCAKSGQSRQSEPCTADRCTKDVEEFFPPTPCQVGGACYCSGPPPNDPIQYPMTCRDTEAYCLHVPQEAETSCRVRQTHTRNEDTPVTNKLDTCQLNRTISMKSSCTTASALSSEIFDIYLSNMTPEGNSSEILHDVEYQYVNLILDILKSEDRVALPRRSASHGKLHVVSPAARVKAQKVYKTEIVKPFKQSRLHNVSSQSICKVMNAQSSFLIDDMLTVKCKARENKMTTSLSTPCSVVEVYKYGTNNPLSSQEVINYPCDTRYKKSSINFPNEIASSCRKEDRNKKCNCSKLQSNASSSGNCFCTSCNIDKCQHRGRKKETHGCKAVSSVRNRKQGCPCTTQKSTTRIPRRDNSCARTPTRARSHESYPGLPSINSIIRGANKCSPCENKASARRSSGVLSECQGKKSSTHCTKKRDLQCCSSVQTNEHNLSGLVSKSVSPYHIHCTEDTVCPEKIICPKDIICPEETTCRPPKPETTCRPPKPETTCRPPKPETTCRLPKPDCGRKPQVTATSSCCSTNKSSGTGQMFEITVTKQGSDGRQNEEFYVKWDLSFLQSKFCASTKKSVECERAPSRISCPSQCQIGNRRSSRISTKMSPCSTPQLLAKPCGTSACPSRQGSLKSMNSKLCPKSSPRYIPKCCKKKRKTSSQRICPSRRARSNSPRKCLPVRPKCLPVCPPCTKYKPCMFTRGLTDKCNCCISNISCCSCPPCCCYNYCCC